MKLEKEDPDHWRAIAEWDWVQTGDDERLHAVGTTSNNVDDDWFGEGATVCGLQGTMWIPGIFSRMSAKRCEECCELTGMPRGDQSPKNIDECRPVVEARIEALRNDSKE